AYDWGTLALEVNERFGDRKRRAKVHQQFNAHVTLWRRPFASCVVHAREACRSGLLNGDFIYAGYGALTEAWPAFLTCRDLQQHAREPTPTPGLLRRIHPSGLADALTLLLDWARALAGGPPLAFSGYEDNPFFMTLFHVARLQLAYLEESFAAAVAALREAR